MRGFIKSRGARQPKVIASAVARLLVLLMVATPSVWAQLRSLDVSQYLHTSWTAQDGYFRGIGVSNNGITQTRDGYIWTLSPTGVFRFDGMRFVEWKPPAGESLPGEPPSQLLASRDGSLWIAGHGVAQIRADGTWHRYHELDMLSRVRLAEDNDGVIWAGAEKSPTPTSLSLFRIDHGKVASYNLSEFVGLGFTPLFVDKRGRLWADSEKGIWQILPGPPKLVHKKTVRTSVFSEDSEGALLYEEGGKIWKVSNEGTAEDYVGKLEANPLNVREMLCDNEGGLWIGTMGQGIVHLHEGRIDHYTSLDGLSSDVVESIFQDREGNVWVTSPESIDKFAKPAVPRLTRKQGLSGDSVYSVLVDRRGNTWIGTSNGFNELIDDHVILPGAQFQNDLGRALIETHAGRLLMTTLSRDMAPDDRHIVAGASGMAWLVGYKNVFSFAEDSDGTLWAVSQELGLLHLRENGELISAFNDPKWGDYPLSVAFDPKRDGIWFSTHNGKVFFLKDGKIVERYGHADGLGYSTVRILQVDADGGVWMAAAAGLAHLMDHKVSILGLKNGLPCNRVHWMRHDQDHHVWLYTACGLVSFSEDDLSSWIAEPSHAVTITDYLDNTDGVENTAVGGWYTPLSAMTRDGRILFAMRTGLGVLDPRHLNQNALPPPVYVEGITADGRAIGSAGHALLPAKTAAIHIAYTALSFAAPRKVRFRYKLQGYDKEWSPPVSLREVTYTNLPSGRYSFRVIACNNNGVWNEQGATVDFVVLPAWYQTLWFKLLVSFAIFCLLTAFYLIRMRLLARDLTLRFDERMSERMRIAREIHDTLLQAVQGLVLSFSNFASEVDAPARVRTEMETALKRADHLMVSGRDRIRDLRGDSDEAGDLIAEIHSVVNETCSGLGPKISVSSAGTLRQLNAIVQEEAVKIVKEALSNACRHSGTDEIWIHAAYERSDLRASVRDNGRGMDLSGSATSQNRHFGLKGMRERAQAIGGRLTIQSTLNEGTVIDLSVPARIAYRKELGWFERRFARRSNTDM